MCKCIEVLLKLLDLLDSTGSCAQMCPHQITRVTYWGKLLPCYLRATFVRYLQWGDIYRLLAACCWVIPSVWSSWRYCQFRHGEMCRGNIIQEPSSVRTSRCWWELGRTRWPDSMWSMTEKEFVNGVTWGGCEPGTVQVWCVCDR